MHCINQLIYVEKIIKIKLYKYDKQSTKNQDNSF